jgi:predicted Zn-dependent protease
MEWTGQPGIAKNQTEFLSHLDGLVIGINPANGIFEGQQFMHPDLDFFIEFPDNWKTMNSRQYVGAISPEKDGLIFLGVSGVGSGPEEVALVYMQALEKEHGIKPSESKSVKIGKWPGYLVTYTDATGREPMHMHFLWVAARGMIYEMIGLAPERLRETLRKTALSFRPLTAVEQASIKETSLHIVSAKAGEDLTQLSSRTNNTWDLKTTAVMNGLSSDLPLKEGQQIKIAVSQTYKGPSD